MDSGIRFDHDVKETGGFRSRRRNSGSEPQAVGPSFWNVAIRRDFVDLGSDVEVPVDRLIAGTENLIEQSEGCEEFYFAIVGIL